MKTTFGANPKVVALSFVKISVKDIQQHSPKCDTRLPAADTYAVSEEPLILSFHR